MYDVSHESDAAPLTRGLINATPVALLLWGVIVGALLWMV